MITKEEAAEWADALERDSVHPHAAFDDPTREVLTFMYFKLGYDLHQVAQIVRQRYQVAEDASA